MDYCFLNGDILSLQEARIGIDDIGVLRGYGVFDFLRVYNGEPFLFKEHMERLRNSASLLGLSVPYPEEDIKETIYSLIEKNQKKDANVRIVLTGGKAISGIDPDTENPTFFILMEEATLIPKEWIKEGVKLVSMEYKRPLPEAKTLDYLVPVRERKRMKEEGAVEILYFYDDLILEGSTSNIFLVKEEKIITPHEGVLRGTTRNFVIELAKKEGFEVEERDVKVEELEEAGEVFLTATNKEILPVSQIDDKGVGEGPGKVNSLLLKKFKEKTGSTT